MQSKYVMKLSHRVSRIFVNTHPSQGFQAIVVACLVFVFSVSSSFVEAAVDEKRNELIGYMLYKQLPSIHFSDKTMNDDLAQASFDLYLKQLDYQKRFLLQKDVAELSRYATAIDNNLKSGSTVLPEVGFAIMAQRIDEAKKIVTEILAEGVDTSREEKYETDPEKLEYASDSEDLRQRWRKILKAQVIGRYLDLAEEQKDAEKKEQNARQNGGDDEAALWSKAREKVEVRNRTFFTRLNRQTLQDHYDRFFNAVTRAFDPHTNYMPPAKKEDFDIHMRGSLEGIGALLREEDGYIKVVRIIPGSASERQGSLLAEDIILAVAEGDEEPVEVTDMRLREAVRLIRGPKGTEVRLTVKKPDGTTEIIPIIRDVVQIEETFVKSTVLPDVAGARVGYIKIPSFYRDFEVSRNNGEARNSTDDTRRALEEMADEDIDGLILDLRNDGGGSLVDAVDITGLFLKSGPVVQVKNSFGKRKVLRDTDDEIVYDGPLVVLVNLFSASASEIVAAALQDYGRAIIIGGNHTHGKGTVQTVVDMNENVPLLNLQRYDDLGALKVTIQKFYRINGGSTQFKGVEPDIVLPSIYAYLQSGEQYLDYALPWDKVEPVSYSPYNLSEIDKKELVANSIKRRESNEGLQSIAEEAEEARKRIENTTISLTLEDMRAERQKSNEIRERVGAQYDKYQKEQIEDFDSPPSRDESPDNEKTWREELRRDPYVGEAGAVLNDIIQQK